MSTIIEPKDTSGKKEKSTVEKLEDFMSNLGEAIGKAGAKATNEADKKGKGPRGR